MAEKKRTFELNVGPGDELSLRPKGRSAQGHASMDEWQRKARPSAVHSDGNEEWLTSELVLRLIAWFQKSDR